MKKALKYGITAIIVITLTIIITIFLRRNLFNFDKKLTKEEKEIIEQYISDINQSNLSDSMTFTSTYYFGDRYNDETLEVYLWVLFEEYDTSDNHFELDHGSSVPYVVIISTSDDKFDIIGYKKPSDGSDYKKSIKELFPIAIRDRVLSFEEHNDYDKLLNEHQEMINIYKEYLKEES